MLLTPLRTTWKRNHYRNRIVTRNSASVDGLLSLIPRPLSRRVRFLPLGWRGPLRQRPTELGTLGSRPRSRSPRGRNRRPRRALLALACVAVAEKCLGHLCWNFPRASPTSTHNPFVHGPRCQSVSARGSWNTAERGRSRLTGHRRVHGRDRGVSATARCAGGRHSSRGPRHVELDPQLPRRRYCLRMAAGWLSLTGTRGRDVFLGHVADARPQSLTFKTCDAFPYFRSSFISFLKRRSALPRDSLRGSLYFRSVPQP